MATDNQTQKNQAQEKTVKVLKGEIGLLVVAPHGYMEDEEEGDDDFTAIIAGTIQKELNCYAVINEKYQRDDVNCNDIKKIQKNPKAKKEFLQPIIDSVEQLYKNRIPITQVLIHGFDDKKKPELVAEGEAILLGRGQRDGNDTDGCTMKAADLAVMIFCLGKQSLNAVEAPLDSGYCGREQVNLNKLFKQKKPIVKPLADSIQFEIRKTGFRETPEQAHNTGLSIAIALKEYMERHWAGWFTNYLEKDNKSFWTALSKKLCRASSLYRRHSFR